MMRDTTAGIRPAGTSRTWGIVLVAVLTVSAIAVGGGVATALQGEKSDPNHPATYYGDVYIDGEPAPVGTTITAEIDGERRGSITVEEAGKIGTPSFGNDSDGALVVRGTANETGKRVTFLVNGEEAATDRPVTFEPYDSSDLNLTGTKGSSPAPDSGSGSDSKSTTPDLEVVDGNLSAETVRVGEQVDVTATVENSGGDGTGTVELFVDGELETGRTVTLEDGPTEAVTVELTFDRPGTYEIAVGEHEVGTVTVRDGAPAEFEVENAQLSATETAAGESVDVTATVRNAGAESGSGTVELFVAGSVAAERELTLDGNETVTVSFTESFERPGEYEIAVGDAEAGTVAVTDDETIPGFGVAAAIAALFGALVAPRRR